MVNKLIIDTDIGDDVDDAYAIAMLSKTLKDNIVAVTTVYKNAKERAKLVKYFSEKFNLNVPVYAGESIPIKENVKFLPFEEPSPTPHIRQYLDKMKESEYSSESAPDMILQYAKEYGSELTILAIGPMTNLAKAYMKDEETFNKIGKIVMMGGCFKKVYAEWNVRCDPESAKAVFDSKVPITMVGVDVTEKATLNQDDLNVLKNCKSEGVALLNELTDVYVSGYMGKRLPVMHDPLTASVLTQDFVKFKELPVTVKTEGDERGMTMETLGAKTCKVAIDADYDSFKRYLLKTLTSENNK